MQAAPVYTGSSRLLFGLCRDTGAVYSGETKDGWPHGQGKCTLPCGDVYVGRLKKGMRDGYGKYTYASGAIYDGQWRKDRKHGHGKLSYYSDGEDGVYVGQWHQDQRHGHGKHTFNCNVYEGQFSHNSMHGQGRMEYLDGVKFEGQWKNNLKHGLIRCEHTHRGIIVLAHFNEGKMGTVVMTEDKVNKVAQEKQGANTRARWQRCIRAVLGQLREDKAATARNVAESARQKAVRDTIKRNKETTDAVWDTSTILRGQRHEPVRALPEASDAAANAVRQTEKEANLARLHEQTVARCAKEAENRARLAERKANIRIGYKINEEE